MPKRAKKTPNTCEQHLFILKPKHNFCRFGQTLTVAFCDPASDKSKGRGKKRRNCQSLDCPIFNNDKNFATPTFILKSQKQYYDERGAKMREQHERKMIEYTDQKDELNIPKPRTRNNFCSVCRQVYQDYLQVHFPPNPQHIQSQNHKKKINTSLFNKYIIDASDKFNPTNNKNIYTYNYHTLSTRDQDDIQILENRPIKKIKYDQQVMGEKYDCQQGLRQQQQQIMPPPHLNLSNSAYFPGLGQNLQGFNYFPNQITSYPIPQMAPQMTFNYNMNFFWPPSYYNPQAYGMMNPWFAAPPMEYLPTMQTIDNSNMQRVQQQQNYFWQSKALTKPEKSLFEVPNMDQNVQEKKRCLANMQQIIVIDEEEQNFNNKELNIA